MTQPQPPQPTKTVDGERRCTRCSQVATGVRGEPAMEMVNDHGFIETLAIAYIVEPCGCTLTVATRR